MKKIGIVGNGPDWSLPDLKEYQNDIFYWIGADRGSLSLIQQGIRPNLSAGDFDSVSESDRLIIMENSDLFRLYDSEKDETDLEIAIIESLKMQPDEVYLFGVTGGRLDHELANLQLLYLLKQKGIEGRIIDCYNSVTMAFPGTISIKKNPVYPYVSFLPFSSEVKGITLKGFYYPLEKASIEWGSTRCVSNEIKENEAMLKFEEGIVYIIQSNDVIR